MLAKHGYDIPLADQMPAGRYQELRNVVNAELDAIDYAAAEDPR